MALSDSQSASMWGSSGGDGIGYSGSGFPSAGSADASGLDSGGGPFSGLSSLLGGANPLGVAAAGGGLLANILGGNKTDPNETALQGQAGALASEGSDLTSQGQGLQQYLTQGTLPPALQAKVEADTQANKARVLQNAGATGSSANPAQNSALTQDLAAADRSGTIEAGDYETKLAQVGQQMIGQGLQATGLSSQLYETLYKYDAQQNTDLMSSITNFAKALAPLAAA